MVDMGAHAENSPVLSEDGNTRVGGSEIDTNSSGHFDGSFVFCRVWFVKGVRFTIKDYSLV